MSEKKPEEVVLLSADEVSQRISTIRAALPASSGEAGGALSSIEAHIADLTADRLRLFNALTEDPNWSNEFVHFGPGAFGGSRAPAPLSSLSPQERARVRRCRDSRLWFPSPAGTAQNPSGVEWPSPPVSPDRTV